MFEAIAHNKKIKHARFAGWDAYTQGGFAIMPYVPAPQSLVLYLKGNYSKMEIYRADKTKIEAASKVFDLYRQFYGQPSNLNASTKFLSERFETMDSRFFIALSSDEEPLGFIQLYPSFSSVAMKKMWYLNDLFVVQSARGKGVASALLDHVKTYAKENDSFSLKLATAIDNVPAKALYEKHGYSKVTAFDHYVLRTDTV